MVYHSGFGGSGKAEDNLEWERKEKKELNTLRELALRELALIVNGLSARWSGPSRRKMVYTVYLSYCVAFV